MNTRCFRLIFSHVQRQWVAVGENVRRGRTPGGGRSARRHGAGDATPFTSPQNLWRPFGAAALSALIALGVPATASSQIVAAPGPHAPGVSVTPNGLPLVNITTPSGAGVSQNQYQQFDVPTQGAILNNARTIVQTQMGGLVPGNPNLTGAPARIIVNQVTGALPSNLAGYLEVAGSRAEVIISNPNGLTCDGCGFVNTSRGVLTTGLPVFGGTGSLEAFRVTDGQLRITGRGLNAGNLEHAALLARAVEVNAAVHAQQLDVITGLNEIDAATFGINGSQTSSGGAPAFSLDLAQLGGMYAGKIRLIGTEAGVGVNLDGHITATHGALTLDSAGALRIGGKLQAHQDLRLRADEDVSISGEAIANGPLTLSTARNLVSSGTLRSARDVRLVTRDAWRHTGTVSAGQHITADAAAIASSGGIAAGANADGTTAATGNLSLSTKGLLQASGTHTAAGDIRLLADGIDLTGSTSTVLHGLQMTARGGHVAMTQATTKVDGMTQITAARDVIHDGATLSTSGLVVEGAGLSNRGGRIEQWGAASPLRLTLSGSLINRDGQILANSRDLVLSSGQIDNTAGKIEHAGTGNLGLGTGNVENVGGIFATNGSMSVEANDWRNDRGTLSAKQSLTATLRGQLTNTVGLMQSGGLFSLKADDIKNLGGRMLALGNADLHLSADNGIENGRLDTEVGEMAGRGNVRLDATSLVNNGTWIAQGSLLVNAAGDLLNVGGRIVARHQVAVAARGAFDNTRGTVTAGEALTVGADAVDNSLGEIQSRSLAVSARTLRNRSGKLIQTGTGLRDLARLRVADHLNNQSGTIHLAKHDAAIDTFEFENANGTVAHAGDGVLSVNGQTVDNRGGRIGTNGDLLLKAKSLDNANGRVTAIKNLASTVTEQLSNVSGELAATAVSLNVGEAFDNRSGSVEASDTLLLGAARINNAKGRLLNSGHAQTAITVRNELDNTDGGSIAANANLSVDAGSLNNAHGRLHAGDSLALKVAADVANNAGYLVAGGRQDVDIGGSFANRAGQVSAHDALRIDVAGHFENTSGKVDVSAASGQMNVSARGLDNAGGSFANAGTGAIDIAILERLRNRSASGQAPDRAGSIAGNGAINLRANSIENIDGARIAAGTSLSLTSAKDIDNRFGRLLAKGPLTVTTTGDISNIDGQIHSGNALTLTTHGKLDNTRGSIETAGDPSIGGDNALAVRATTLDNTDGRIVNGARSGGDLVIIAESIVNALTRVATPNRPIALIGGNGSVSITAFSLLNGPNAHVSAGTDLSLSVRDKLGNAGTVFSGGDLNVTWRDAERTRAFENTGNVQARRDASVAVDALDHRSGEIAVNRNLKLRTGSLLGTARLRAGNDLSIALPGDFTYGVGHDWQANGNLTLDVGGLLRVHGALGAIKQLTVNAAHLVNADQGRLRGESVLLNVAGDMTNQTRIDGDDLRLHSIRFVNTGAVIGGRIRFDGEHFSNTGDRAVLAATRQLDIFATGEVLNENGATLYSLGDLRVAAGEARDAQGFLTQQSARFINRSAVVEAGADVDIATREFVNDRSFVNVVRGAQEDETRQVRDLWIAGFVALPDVDSRARCAAGGGTCEELPTVHLSHSLSVDGEPALIREVFTEITGAGKEALNFRIVPNPRNQAFTQWRWSQEARAALSSEKLNAVSRPISVTLPKRGLTALDVDTRTFSLEKPIVEVYHRRGSLTEYDTRTITQRAVQHFEAIHDDGQGNWVIQFWPDFDPSTHIRPTVVDQSNSTITGAADEGVRIFRRGYGISDNRDNNEYRRSVTIRSKTDVMGDVAEPGVLTSQGTIRLNVDNGTALNHAATISAGGNIHVRGNGGQITSRSIGLERVERIEQSSDLYWHEKRGNSDSSRTSVNFDVTERRSIVGGLQSLISSNGTTHLRGRDITIETATVDGTVIGSRQTDSDVGTSQRVAVDASRATVSTGEQAPVDTPVDTSTVPDISGAVQTLDTAAGGIPGLKLPRSALFSVVETPGHPYLVETDARFTDRGTFVSSNYMLDLLGIAPANVERRIGDGFYEAKLVREQILALTGRASLNGRDGNASAAADAEFRALLTQGASAGRDLELRVGIQLTSEQMRALTDDIVWLVRQTVMLPNGTSATVLVPTVYLAHGKRVVMQPGGALVTGRDVIVEATNRVSNSGQIVGDSSTRIRAFDVENRGVIGGSGGLGGLADQGNAGVVEVVAERDFRNIGGEIAGERVNVTAGRDVVVTSQSRANEWVKDSQRGKTTAIESIGHIDARDAVVITAGRDLSVTGAAIDAGGNVDLAAGRDLSLGAIASGREFGGGSSESHSRTQVTEHVSSAIRAGGDATFMAGRDASSTGANVDAGKRVVIAAARDVEIGAAIDTVTDMGRVSGDTYTATVDSYEESVQGSRIHARNGIGIAAGQAEAIGRLLDARGVTAYVSSGEGTQGDVRILGAYLNAGTNDGTTSGTQPPSTAGGTADLKIVATGDVTVGGVSARYDDTRSSRSTRNGVLSSTTEESYRESHGTRTAGSTLSGDAVTIAAGRDVTITGSQVVADGDMTIGAKRNVTIASAADESNSLSVTEKTTTGVFGDGFGVTIGSRSEKEKQRREEINQTGSVVGSIGGDVAIRAGNDYRQEGSMVVARDGDVSIAGKRVSIVESEASEQRVHEREVKQAGLTVAISSPLLNAAQTVGQMGKAVGKVNDARMKALGVAAGGLAVKNAVDNVKNLKDAANVSVSVTVGGSKQVSRETNDSTTSTGSTVRAGGNVTIAATGDGDQSSLLVRGSEIAAGQDVKLKSDGTLDILAAKDTSEHHRTSSGMSGGIGLGISMGANGATMGVTASASASRGKADGKDVTQRNSHIVAGGVAEIVSGGDTNIRGGTVVGERVVADIGGDLNIESLQDTSVYASKDQSISGSGTVGVGGASGSINVSHQQVNSDFASVTEQSGIKAGDGGFDVTVKGNTDLTGAIIASTDKAADEDRNRLKTGSLTTRDVENHAEYDAFGISLGGGISMGGGENAKVGTDQKGDAQTGAKATPGSELPKTGPVSITPPVVVAAGDSASSTTRSGISAGVIEITNEASQRERTGKTAEETVASVNRDVSSDKDGSGALTNKFDKEQIETSFEIMQTLQREVGTFVGNRAKEAEVIEAQLKKTTDPEQRAVLNQQLADAKKWGPGGDYRLIVSAITAGISGNVTGATGEMATRATVNYLQGLAAKEIKALGENLDPASKAALHAVTGCAGSAASAGNCDAGAMGSAAGSLLGSLLAAGDKPGQDLSQSEREARVNLITSIVAGVTAGIGGDVATASVSAKTEAENNTLGVRIAPPPPRQAGGTSEPQGGKRGGRDGDELDPTSASGGTTASEDRNVADQLKDALTKAACAISGLACSNQLIVDGVITRVIGDGMNDDNVIGTPNEGPRGVTIAGTPDTGEKGPSIIGTPDKGEREDTVISTPDPGEKGPNVIATPNNGPWVSDPLLDKLHIRDHYDHHQQMVNDLKDQIIDLGYRVSDKEISFGNSCGSGRCRPDIVMESPDGKLRIIEVKTGDSKLSERQSDIFPQIQYGNSIPRGKVAKDFGLIPGIPLKDQGYPNGIEIEIAIFPGAKK